MAEDQLAYIDKMTNVELRAELKRRGCSTSGIKKDLIAKLYAAIHKETENSSLNNSVELPQIETPIDDQATLQYSSSASTIASPQKLPISSSVEHHQLSPMNVANVNDTSIVSSTPERQTRARNKKSSINCSSNENLNTTSKQQLINSEQNVLDLSINGNNVEVKSSVSKSIEEEKKDIEKIVGEGGAGESHAPSVGSNSAKLESILKENPLPDEQQRLNETKSEQQQDNQSVTIAKEPKPVTHVANDDMKNQNEVIDRPSHADLSTDFIKAATIERSEIIKEDEPTPVNSPIVKTAAQQSQLKTNCSQLSPTMKGLNRSTNNKINLSSEILKTLIPDISLLPESVVNDDFDSSINEQTDDDNPNNGQATNEPVFDKNISTDFHHSDSMTIGDLADQKLHTNRTVVMNVNMIKPSSLNDDINMRKKTNSISTYAPASFESKVSMDGKTNTIMTDEPVRIKNTTAVNQPLSQILYIRGLTRPFSLLQLKELLRRYGTLVEGEFWLDKIKSQCLVTYDTLEEAQNAREALDGCRWPSTNPKALSIRFAQQTELEFSKTHDLPPDQMSIDSVDRIIQDKSNTISSRRSASPSDEKKSHVKKNSSDVQEWDVPKLEKKSYHGFLITEENEPVKPTESPTKGLDDYFRKTKTKPSIYWLPLTEEQITERNRELAQRNSERDEERRKRELDENAHTSNSKSNHRSLSSTSKEKRKHSSSPSNQYSKRR
ncbi:unnamed protein product [Rotaria socialis]|uniref:Apoptotic chromatin condensation inducer in the nucleus n=1 Tax=Rotaria socialis TaxID=392032 RepID=A0A818ZFC2_9BILA|nr:unnamed protein product [Rotaria socialis]CAF3165147.1 unnamed protein product [Rotaria socialis]CAF3717863.1 unnamed protein product [Rotaria socialis]CAF3764153.1 unnamed protein product [Rotaria socialis]CAF3790232.1 unnamed protein product [Rotaria socialis]